MTVLDLGDHHRKYITGFKIIFIFKLRAMVQLEETFCQRSYKNAASGDLFMKEKHCHYSAYSFISKVSLHRQQL